MTGLMDYKDTSFVERKLKLSKEHLKNVITTIVGRFVQLQKTNPLLLVEAIFRFQSREIKEAILNNYGLEFRRNQPDVQAENHKTGEDMEIDQNIVFEDEKPIYNVFDEKDLETNQIEGEDKKQWTQQQDQILIDNYA